MTYQAEVHHQVAKDLKRLDRTTIERIGAKINEVAQDPFDPRISRQMETAPDSRYSRVGDWRIICRVGAGTLDIVAIRPRSRAYR